MLVWFETDDAVWLENMSVVPVLGAKIVRIGGDTFVVVGRQFEQQLNGSVRNVVKVVKVQ